MVKTDTNKADLCDMIRQRIIDLVRIKPRTLGELHDAIPEADDRVVIARICGALKRIGTVVKREDDKYQINDNFTRQALTGLPPEAFQPTSTVIAAALEAAGIPEARRDEPAQSAPAGQHSSGHTRRTLQKLVADTQEALDEYVLAIADMEILTPLQAARDSARQALAALERKPGAQ